MTENMQDHNNPQLPRYIKGGEEGERNPKQNQQLNDVLTTQGKTTKVNAGWVHC